VIFGFLMDLLIGDPHGWPHLVIGYGKLIGFFDKKLNKKDKEKKARRRGGYITALCLAFVSLIIPTILLFACFRIHFAVAVMVDIILCWQCLAIKSLRDETRPVFDALRASDIEGARKAVGMVVGRDTDILDEKGIIRAAVETVAENTSDGIGAPLICMCIGFSPLACFYKAVNTMDSMIGYKNEKYADFGYAAAKLDDICNFIPSRMTALAMILASFFCDMNAADAYRIWKRDRRKHASPNSAQTESVMAGALGVKLAGPTSYFGIMHDKPYIGDDRREIECEDIIRSHKLMYVTSIILLVLAIIWRLMWTAIFMAAF